MKQGPVILCLFILLSGCASRYVFTLTNKQVKARYANRAAKPVFGYFENGSRSIYYALMGSDTAKPLLVLVHGAPGRWYSSINLLDDSLLHQHYRILAYDRPGYGRSNPGWQLTSIDAQAEALAALIRFHNTGNRQVTLVGRSYGTAIAARYAMNHPEQVEKLLLLGSCVDPKKEKYFWFSYANKLGVIQHFMPGGYNVATDEKFAHRRELKNILPGWENILSPTYVVHGGKDWMADTANAWFAYRHIVNAPVAVYLLPESGHNVTFSNADLVKTLILQEPGLPGKTVLKGEARR